MTDAELRELIDILPFGGDDRLLLPGHNVFTMKGGELVKRPVKSVTLTYGGEPIVEVVGVGPINPAAWCSTATGARAAAIGKAKETK